MCQQVGVPLLDMLRREGPMIQRGARVMVVYERHRARGPQAHHAWGAALRVGEAPALVPPERLLQDALRGEVEGRGGAAGGVAPVHSPLPMGVLVVGEHPIGVVASIPELSDGQPRHGGVHVLLREVPTVSLHEVEAETVVADDLAHPLHPLLQLGPHHVVGVVNVGGGSVLIPGPGVASSAPFRIVAGDHALIPGEAAPKLVPPAVLLDGGAAMVDHDVRDGLDVALPHLLDQVYQLLLGSVLRVQVVQVQRQVPLLTDRLRRWRQPDACETSVRKLVNARLHIVVPTHPIKPVARLPVETLQQDLVALATTGPAADGRGRLCELWLAFASWLGGDKI
mmetsp:Transcript_10316/g.17757  ORF Transcript_10316/g.17757 Transcript_10316/m.17757 type:complete len:339 (+) Transcript_10316:872-1888(+)